jgi:outer membrane protein
MTFLSSRLLCASAVLAGLCLAGAAHAQSAGGERPPAWSLGIAATWSPSPYRSYDNKAWPLPLVNYEGKSFYFRGVSFGYRLLTTPGSELSLVASPLGQRFRHDDTDDARLRRLSDRDISGLAGLAWQYRADWGVLHAGAQKEFTGHGGGTQLDASYGYPIRQGALTLLPTVGMQHRNSALNDYYYGIGAKQAARSGLPAYHAGGGNQPYLDLSAVYRLSPRWSVTGGLRYTRLPDSVKDSPMTDADATRAYFLGVSHSF